jgi:hypothetical protein
VPETWLIPRDVARDAQGNVLDRNEPVLAGCEVLARLVTDWHVYDATSGLDDQPPLALPATGDLVAKLPSEIQNRLSNEVNERRNPTKTPSTTPS